MPVHPDILDERAPLRRYVWYSVALHVALLATMAASALISGPGRQSWGDPNSIGGGSIGITPVSRLPIPARRGLENPVANPTESQVPQPPKPEVARRREPEPDAIALKGRTKQASRESVASRQRYSPPGADRPNQLHSSGGAAASSPMFGGATGSGVGVGAGSPFGARFGYYEQILRQRVSEKWRTAEIDPNLKTAPAAIVTFDILRNGTIRSVRVAQSSGNVALDYSAQRAIMEAAPFPPLPAGFERDSATIEFWFQLKR